MATAEEQVHITVEDEPLFHDAPVYTDDELTCHVGGLENYTDEDKKDDYASRKLIEKHEGPPSVLMLVIYGGDIACVYRAGDAVWGVRAGDLDQGEGGR